MGLTGQPFGFKQVLYFSGRCCALVGCCTVKLHEQDIVNPFGYFLSQDGVILPCEIQKGLVHDLDPGRIHGQDPEHRLGGTADTFKESHHQAVMIRLFQQPEF